MSARTLRIALLLTASLLAVTPAPAQVCDGWIAEYDSPFGGFDVATALAIAPDGAIVVAGTSSGPAGLDYLVLEYAPHGELLWAQRYDGPVGGDDELAAMALDAAGNIYVTGISDGGATGLDFATVRVDSDGAIAWVARADSCGRDDVARDIAVTPDGDVYVTGSHRCEDGGLGFLTVAYDAVGSERWTRTYEGPLGDDEAVAVVVNPETGGAFVSGPSEALPVDESALVKYAVDGSVEWVRRYHIGPDSPERPTVMAMDPERNGLVIGGFYRERRMTRVVRPSDGGSGGLFNTDGRGVSAITTDVGGVFYLTGARQSANGLNTLKFVVFPNGWDDEWQRFYSAPGDAPVDATGADVDAAGDLYIVGAVGESPARELLVLKYDPEGHLLWERFAPAGGTTATAVAADRDGHVYVAGGTGESRLRNDVLLIKLYQAISDAFAQLLEVTRGLHLLGDVLSLEESDDDHVIIFAERPAEVSQPSVQIAVEGHLVKPDIGGLALELEASVTTGGVRQTIELFDFFAGVWVVIDEREATTNDSITLAAAPGDVDRFMTPAEHRTHARISFYDLGLPPAAWFARIDRIRWEACSE